MKILLDIFRVTETGLYNFIRIKCFIYKKNEILKAENEKEIILKALRE